MVNRQTGSARQCIVERPYSDIVTAACHNLRGHRAGPKGILLKLDGIEGVDAARACAGANLSVHESAVPDELLVAEFDPVGCEVRDAERGSLGTVSDVIVTGANDVWVVQGDYGEVLIPVIDDVIGEVDEDARIVHVRLLPGLIEE